jgi:hypothetical protein
MSQPPVLVSLLLLSDHGQGHVRDYNEAVGRAAALAGWDHRAALVKNWQGTGLPPAWEVVIDSPDLKSFWRRNLGYATMARSLARYLRERILPLDRPAILFVENLSTSTLIVLWLALRQVPRERLALWVLIRFSLRTRGPAGVVGRAMLGKLSANAGGAATADRQPAAGGGAADLRRPLWSCPSRTLTWPRCCRRRLRATGLSAWWAGGRARRAPRRGWRRCGWPSAPARLGTVDPVAAAGAALAACSAAGGARCRPA